MRIEKPRGRITQVWQNPVASDQRKEFFEDNVDKDIVVTYEVVHEIHTKAQRGFYRGAVLPAISKATGETDTDRIHKYLKNEYLLEKDIIFGKKVEGAPTLSEISRIKFSHYIDDCINFLADNGGSIDPQIVDEYESIMEKANDNA